ncbi:tetraspanin-16 isoform X1 [Acomys russatus]|uniref:tetraspanin-16 isoform X1 n=1 Tax=Acomys russatus TaxID=60746 RepID=UPI0021E23591|nr:tetraspanin-16 isoform X1 [Acomys russatus]
MPETHMSYSFLKKLLSLFNGFTAMSGMVLTGLGLGVKYGEATLTKVLGMSSAYLFHFGFLSLGMGCLTIVLSLVGWYGTSKESRCTLLMYVMFLVIIVILEVVVASVVLVFFPLVQDIASEHTLLSLRRNYRGYNEPDDFSAQWNIAMEKLKCCGVKNYTDFAGSSFQVTTGQTYPRGCCKSIGSANCNGYNVSSDVIYQEGCFVKLLKITRSQSFTLSAVSLGAAAVQLPGTLATLLLFMKLG